MAISYGVRQSLGRNTSGGSSNSKTSKIIFGRVIDVINDAFHPEYDTYQKSLGLYGVIYREVSIATPEEEEAPKRFAYCGRGDFIRLPLKNEFVVIENRPQTGEARDATSDASKFYWTDIVNLWNHPHHNAYPDTIQVGEGTADLGDHFKEQSKINPLQLFPGDTVLQSRYGSSIRMSGTKYDSNKISTNSNNGKPFTIIRNGQHDETRDGDETIIEDINKDSTSIYLTSDHKVDLEQANDKQDAWDKKPELANKYDGAQILVNSNRVFINAKEEGIYLSAVENIGLNSKFIGIDSDKYISLDSKKIYLGKVALKREDEPVLLGQSTIELLNQFITQVELLTQALAKPLPPPAYVASVSAVANSVVPQLPPLKSRLKTLLSKKVYTE